MPRTTILLASNRRDSRTALATILQRAGYDTLEAVNGPIALRIAKALYPDAIVAESVLPLRGGPALVDALDANPDTAGIPILVLTPHADAEADPPPTRPGAVLPWPVAPRALLEAVRTVLVSRANAGMAATPAFAGPRGGRPIPERAG